MSWYEVLKKHDATVARLRAERDYAIAESRELLRTHREQSAAREADVEHLRRLLCWVYEHHSRGGVNWALVCDEECEIAAIAEEGGKT